MAIYSFFEPPLTWRADRRGPDRVRGVRDGFHWAAFLFGPLWMLWHRLWLVLIGYLVVTAALHAGLWALGVSASGRMFASILLAWLIGLEAGTLRRWTLRRRGWREAGVASGATREEAERRFFDQFTEAPSRAPASGTGHPAEPQPQSLLAPVRTIFPVRRQDKAATDVVGLFPQPPVPGPGSAR